MSEPEDPDLPPSYAFPGMPGFVPTPPPQQPPPPSQGPAQPPPPPPTAVPPAAVHRPPPMPSGPSIYGSPGAPGGSRGYPVTTPSGPHRPPTYATGAGSPGKGWGKAAAGFALTIGAVVLVANLADGGSGDTRDPSDPFSTLVAPDESERLWTVDFPYSGPRPLSSAVDGNGDYLQPNALVADDLIVQRVAQDPFEGTVEAVVARGLDDGEVRWTRELPEAVCDTHAPGGGDPTVLACASTEGSGPRLQLLDLGSGEPRREWSVPSSVALIRAVPTGIVTVDVPDQRTGVTQVRWYSPAGEDLWTHRLPEEGLQEVVRYDAESGWVLASGLGVVPVGDGAMLTSYSGALLAEETGSSLIEDCWSPAVVGDGVLCPGYPETQLLVDGERVWGTEDLDLLSFERSRQTPPVLITRDRGSGSGADSYRWVDPATGIPGPQLLSVDTYVRGLGNADHPVLLVQEETEDYSEPVATTVTVLDPETGTVVWTAELQARSYTDVAVVGDRVVVEIDYGSWSVLDAATGEVVGGTEASGGSGWIEVEGDAVVATRYSELSRIDLP